MKNEKEEKPVPPESEVNDGEGSEVLDAPVPPKKDKPLSSDVVHSEVAKTIKRLETQIAGLQDKLDDMHKRNASYEEKLALLAKVPSNANPARTLLEDLEEFLGGNPFAIFAKPAPASDKK